jgi:hypothetical protein
MGKRSSCGFTLECWICSVAEKILVLFWLLNEYFEGIFDVCGGFVRRMLEHLRLMWQILSQGVAHRSSGGLLMCGCIVTYLNRVAQLIVFTIFLTC